MKMMKMMKTMKLVRVVTAVIAGGGLAALAFVAAPSVSGQDRRSGEQREQREPREPRELTVLAGRGVEIGVSIRDVEASDKVQAGVLIEDVRPESPAEKAGLKKSDVIVEFDGEHVRSARQFTRLVHETAPGRSVKATVVRDGQKKTVDVTPADGRMTFQIDSDRMRERVDSMLADRLPPMNFDFNWDGMGGFNGRGTLGITVSELTPQLASYFGAQDGVLVASVSQDSPASRAGLKAGDVITTANGTRVHSREDLMHQMPAAGDGGEVSLGVVREHKETTMAVKIEPRRSPRNVRPA